jgi:DNA-directed RNA polymerase specialized sigma24 family protein
MPADSKASLRPAPGCWRSSAAAWLLTATTDRPNGEIARELGISLGAAAERLFGARAAIRNLLTVDERCTT